MRQTLFRIHLDNLFSFAPIDGVTAVGGILLFFAWAAYGLYTLWSDRRTLNDPGRWVVPGLVWFAVAGVILTAPLWSRGRIPNGLPVFGYGVMVFCGFLGGALMAARRARRDGLDPSHIWDLLTWMFGAGIGGARLFYLVQKHRQVYAGVSGPAEFVQKSLNLTDGGLVLLGGVLAVVAAVFVFCRRRGISPLRMADVVVPSFFLGLAFGRVGCLLNGCCFGDRCELPWGLHFPAGSVPWGVLVERGFLGPDSPATYALHPTQVYSAITALGLCLLTAAYFPRRPYNGAVLILGMVLYAVKRTVVEFLRGDELGQFGTMFTISQWISAGIFLTALVLWLVLWVGRRGGHAVSRPVIVAG